MKKKIYIGCSLTHAPEEYKEGIKNLKAQLSKQYEILEFIGLEKGTYQDVFEHDTKCVKSSDLFVAECSYPSIGLGYELGLALSLNKQILAVAGREAKVTRLVQGVTHPMFTFRRYDKLAELNNFVMEKLQSK